MLARWWIKTKPRQGTHILNAFPILCLKMVQETNEKELRCGSRARDPFSVRRPSPRLTCVQTTLGKWQEEPSQSVPHPLGH